MPTLMPRLRATGALLFLALLMTGCLAAPVKGPLPAGITIEPVDAPLSPASLVAVSPDGALLALSRPDGLYLRPLDGGAERRFGSEAAVALAFSRDGAQLAAADATGRLVRYAVADGAILGELLLSGRCEAILARDREWLIFVSSLDTFRFGANLNSRLLRWNGVDPPVEQRLNDATIDRKTLAAGMPLLATLRPQLSPFGDELLFWRLHDPPAFDPNIRLVLRHLESGSERIIVTLPGTGGAAAYLDGGTTVAHGDGVDRVIIIAPWTEEKRRYYPGRGRRIAAPASGELLWLDQTLIGRDGGTILTLAGEAAPVVFLPGGRLLLRSKERLWLLRGLPVAPEPAVADEKVLHLRQWRAEGLITPQEYEEQVRSER